MEERNKAAILSLLIAGLGQVYLGRIIRGSYWLLGGFMVISSAEGQGIPLGAPIVWIASAWDAYHIAKGHQPRYRAAKEASAWGNVKMHL